MFDTIQTFKPAGPIPRLDEGDKEKGEVKMTPSFFALVICSVVVF